MNIRRYDSRLYWGVLLVAGGILFLLQNLGLLPFGDLIWAVVFAGAGALFLALFFRDRASWWAIIPGLTLIGIGLIIALALIAPNQTGAWLGGVFLGMIGLAFWIIYFMNRTYWWAIIPGGTLLTLALVAVGTALWNGMELGGLFFLGLGLTFALVAIVPTLEGRMTWAYIPAVILLLMGVLIMAASTSLINYLGPLALVALGVFLVWRTFRYKRS
jgi:hypothetical protein